MKRPRAVRTRNAVLRLSLVLLAVTFITGLRGQNAHAASIVVAADSGYVLKANDADVLWHPASLTKLMTVLLTFEALDAGDIELSDILKVSPTAAAQPPTELGLHAGQSLSVDTAINATILRSANDAAVVLAEALAGTEQRFAEHMTARAKELGMTSTVFRNATGLPNAEQVTTAQDMATLARHLVRDMPSYLGYFDAKSMEYGKRRMSSINGFLYSYEGAFGMKTGFTCASGYNIVAGATRDGQTLIGVLLGASSGGDRAVGIRRLMNEGFGVHPDESDPPPLLASYVEDAPGKPQGPPMVIPQSECGAREIEKQKEDPEPEVAAHDDHLPGWGILVGSFNVRDQAEAAAERNRDRLGGVGKAATPVVLERNEGRARGFSALLVDLSRSQAQGACSALRRKQSYCLALGPEALNNPRALWR